jgi:hypothetical protein
MRNALSGPVTNQADLLRLAGISLGDDEALISFAHIHAAIYWKSVAVLMFAILVMLAFAIELGLFFALVGGIMLVMAHLTRRYLILAATDKRIFVRSGWFYADMIELRYTQVESVELGIMPIGQIFGYGSVIVTGTGNRRIIVPYVTDAVQFRSKVNEILVNK